MTLTFVSVSSFFNLCLQCQYWSSSKTRWWPPRWTTWWRRGGSSPSPTATSPWTGASSWLPGLSRSSVGIWAPSVFVLFVSFLLLFSALFCLLTVLVWLPVFFHFQSKLNDQHKLRGIRRINSKQMAAVLQFVPKHLLSHDFFWHPRLHSSPQYWH